MTDIDQQGRINLSRRDAILALEARRHSRSRLIDKLLNMPPCVQRGGIFCLMGEGSSIPY